MNTLVLTEEVREIGKWLFLHGSLGIHWKGEQKGAFFQRLFLYNLLVYVRKRAREGRQQNLTAKKERKVGPYKSSGVLFKKVFTGDDFSALFAATFLSSFPLHFLTYSCLRGVRKEHFVKRAKNSRSKRMLRKNCAIPPLQIAKSGAPVNLE